MVDHCENCNCENRREYCGLKKETYFKILLMLGLICFIGISIILLKQIMRECTSNWSDPHYAMFALLYSGFIIIYLMVFDVAIEPVENMRVYIPWLYRYMRDSVNNIWNHLRQSTWSDIRLMFSLRRAIASTHSQQEISISDNESNEDRPPPLPPRNRNMDEAVGTTMFQKLTSKVSQGDSSSTVPEGESTDLSSSLSPLPHSSKQPEPSVKSFKRRSKKFLKRQHFKNMMSNVTNLNAIQEEGLVTQGASGVKLSMSPFTQISASDSETEQETSFTTKPHQSGAAEQEFGYINVEESEDPVPTRRVHRVKTQTKTSRTGDKPKDPDQTLGSSARITKKQLSTFQDFKTQSGLKLSNPTSSDKKRGFINAPISKFGTMCTFKAVPLSTLEYPAQEQSFADVHSGSQGEVMESVILGQSSASYIRLPELENQSRAFEIRRAEGSEKSLHQPPASSELHNFLSQNQEQPSTIAFSGSQEHSRFSDIQKSEGNADQAVASYLKLPQLEKPLSVSPIRTQIKQSSPEQSAIRDARISLQGQVSSISGIQTMQTYQEQTSSSVSQRQGRISNIQRRRSSRKHTPIPIYIKSSESESESQEQRLNVQQPMQSCAQFSLAKCQLQTSGIDDVHEFSAQEIETEERTILGGHGLPLSADYARKRFRGKTERATTQKRRESLHIGSDRPFREWSIRTKKTQGSTESTSQLSACAKDEMENTSIQREQIEDCEEGYLPHSTLSRSEINPTQAHVAISPLNKTKKSEDPIRQRSSIDPSHLKEKDNENTQRKETFLTLDKAAGGLVLSKDGAEDENVADSNKQSFRYDQSMNVLDLSHIEVPLPPKNINSPVDKSESQNAEKPIRQSSVRTKTIKGSEESTSQLFACARGGLVTSGLEKKQIEASAGGYLPHSTLLISQGTPSQEHVATTPLKKEKECEGRIEQRSLTEPSHVKKEDKQEAQRTEKDFTFSMAKGGLLLRKDTPKDETATDASEQPFVYDYSMNVLDLSHIEVPLPLKDIKPSKDKGESQTSEKLIGQTTTRTKRTEESVESTSQFSVCAKDESKSFHIRSQKIEASEESYFPHSTLSISEGSLTQEHVTTTPLKSRKEPQDRIAQRSSIDPLQLKETDKQETQRKEKFLSLDLAAGGTVVSKDRAENETERDSSQPLSMCDQPFDVLDLSHIEVPFPPPEDKKASKDKDERQN